jgi:membrane-associated HD superfamily phosphohydrolase
MIPIAGILGTLLYSKLGKGKELFSMLSMLCLAGIFYFYGSMTGMISVIALIASGFFLYPTHVFLVSTIPSRFLEKKVCAASAGMIDGFAYLGAVIIGSLVPFLLKINNESWSLVFNFWAASSVVVAIITLGLYVYSKRKSI